MILRRVARVALVAASMLAVAPMAASYGAGSASTFDASGWWSKSQALPAEGDVGGAGVVPSPTVPPPATVPPKGLYVSADGTADGSAISAVRYRLEGQSGGTLTLHLPSGSTLTGTESIVACPITGGFEPAENGRWDSKPGYDPETCVVEGTAADDKASISFDVPATFSSALGDVAIAIVPAAGATPFSVAFDPPTDESFAASTSASASSASSGTTSDSAYDSGSAAFSSPGSAPASTPSFDAPGAAVGVAPAMPSAPPTDDGEVAAPVPLVAAPTSAGTSRSDQLVAIAALAALGAALWWLGTRPQRAPRLLGSVGGSVAATEVLVSATIRPSRPRGIGRFARPRDAPPTSI